VYLLRVYDKEQPAIFSARTSYELLCDLHDAGLIVAVQSVGTNGVLGACACMVAAGSNGIALWAETLIRQPADFQDILHYVPDQIVLIVREERRSDMEQLCRKWGKQWLQIGVVIDEQKLFVKHCRITMADISADVCRMFGDAVPNTDEDVISEHTTGEATVDLPHPEDCREIAEYLLTSPNLLSQQWLFNQFDSTIGTNNLTTNFISDASVLQLKGTRHAVIAAFGSSLYPVEHYPKAVELMIADIVRKSVCSGGMPLVLTGCLQYSGISDVAFREKSALIRKQIASTCHKLGIAMSDISARYIPTDKINSVHLALGNIAFLEDKRQQMTISFKGKGDMIYLIGKSTDQLGAAEYTRYCHRMAGTQPSIDMDAEVQLLNVVQQIILRKLVKSAHNVSRGGLFMSLLESAMVRGFGFDITVDSEIRKDTFLFGEAPSRVVVSVATSRETDFIDFMMGHHVPFMTLGHVTREEIRIDDNSYGFICDYKQKYFGGLHP
jgi:phosphoribosylformylglycinamidine synthase